jgi:hypothetical protein
MARYPAYSITTDLASGRLRYVAQARSLSSHPYLVITATLNELTAELRPPIKLSEISAKPSGSG